MNNGVWLSLKLAAERQFVAERSHPMGQPLRAPGYQKLGSPRAPHHSKAITVTVDDAMRTATVAETAIALEP